jgi:hypothetical protein
MPRLVSSGSVQVLSLRKLFAELDDELIVRIGEDGHLYLAHRFTADYPTKRIRLDQAEPQLERVGRRRSDAD